MSDQSEYTTTNGHPVPSCVRCGEELFLKMIQVCVACEDKPDPAQSTDAEHLRMVVNRFRELLEAGDRGWHTDRDSFLLNGLIAHAERRDQLKTKHATAREDYARACHALDEAHGMLKDARAELAALKQRLAGLDVWELRDESFPSSYGEYIRAADLDALLKEKE